MSLLAAGLRVQPRGCFQTISGLTNRSRLMRILQVIPSVSPVHGGPSRAIVDIERALTARGIEVTTVATNDDGNARTLAVPCGIPVVTPSATRWYFEKNTNFFKVSIGLARWLHENIRTFDVVHAHALFSFAPVVAAFLARRAGVPYVLRPLGVLAPYGMANRHPFLKKASFALVERRLLQSASAVHFTSLAEKTEAEALGLKCNGISIPLGIELADPLKRPNWRGPDDAVNLLFLARIDPKKNLESLLRALHLVVATHPNIMLSVAGDGDPNYVETLKTLARGLAIDGNVNWMGYVDGGKKSDLLAAAHAFVLPSFSENFGIAAVEALAAGLPCLVSRGVAVSREIDQAGAGFVTGTTPGEIAAGIGRILDSRTQMAAMSMAARELAANAFSLGAMGIRLEALYRDILASQEAGRVALAS